MRWAALVLALTATLALPARAQREPRPRRQTPSGSRPALELARWRSLLAEAKDTLDLRHRLLALEPEALPFLFHVLESGAVPAGPGPADTARALRPEEQVCLHEVLTLRSRRELVLFLETLVADEPGLHARVVALDLLGAVGSREHLHLLVRLATPASGPAPLPPELRGAFESALRPILARDPAALSEVRAVFDEAPPGLSGSIVAALASTRSPEAFGTLATLLGISPGLDPLILARLGEHGPSGRIRIDENARERVRRYLTRPEEGLLVAAARTAGRLEDDEAVELLIGLMDHSEARVREGAFDALARISGLTLGQDARRWTLWFQTEMRWWEEESADVLLRIERGRGVEFTRAARLALEHHLFRDRVAESFAQALNRKAPEEVHLCCRALEELRSPAAIPGLIECLDRSEPGLREAAWKALRAITGVELPPDPESWASFSG